MTQSKSRNTYVFLLLPVVLPLMFICFLTGEGSVGGTCTSDGTEKDMCSSNGNGNLDRKVQFYEENKEQEDTKKKRSPPPTKTKPSHLSGISSFGIGFLAGTMIVVTSGVWQHYTNAGSNANFMGPGMNVGGFTGGF